MTWKLISIPLLLAVLWLVAVPWSSTGRTTVTPGLETAATSIEPRPSAVRAVDLGAPEHDRTIQLLAYKIDQLTRRVEQLEAQPQAEHNDHAERTAAAAPAAPSWSEHLQQLQQSFETEHHDPAWSSKNAREIRSIVGSLPKLESALRSLDCRSQHCRVELSQDDSSEFSDAAMALNLKLAATLPTAEYQYVDRGHGERSIVVYYSQSVEPSQQAAPHNL